MNNFSKLCHTWKTFAIRVGSKSFQTLRIHIFFSATDSKWSSFHRERSQKLGQLLPKCSYIDRLSKIFQRCLRLVIYLRWRQYFVSVMTTVFLFECGVCPTSTSLVHRKPELLTYLGRSLLIPILHRDTPRNLIGGQEADSVSVL